MVEILVGITVVMWIAVIILGTLYVKESIAESKRYAKLMRKYNV